MATTKMTRKGQVTIPVEIRQSLNLHEGDVLLVREEGGRVVLESQRDIVRRIAGSISAYAKGIPPVTADEIDEIVGQAVVEDYLASLDDR